MLLKAFHDAAIRLAQLESRFDPFFRPAFDAVSGGAHACDAEADGRCRAGRTRAAHPAEERELPGERECVDSIINDMAAYMRDHYAPGRLSAGGEHEDARDGARGADRARRRSAGDAARRAGGASHVPRVGALRRSGPAARRTSTTSAC